MRMRYVHTCAGWARGDRPHCFVADPDGYRIELIDRDFPTPQDPDD